MGGEHFVAVKKQHNQSNEQEQLEGNKSLLQPAAQSKRSEEVPQGIVLFGLENLKAGTMRPL